MSRSGTAHSLASNGLVDVSVIIVTYNSAACVDACLTSIERQQDVRAEIIVVDNSSADETARLVHQRGGSVTLLANQENTGFGRGCNQGFAVSHGRFAFFLNPDAQLEQTDGLVRLCQAMADNPRWGLAGTRVLSPDGQNESDPATSYPGQRHCRRDFSTLPGKIAWVVGASMFVRRESFAAVGGFDPAFFLYSEETDLCLRLRLAGQEIGFVPDVTVRHIGRVSERGQDIYQTRLRVMAGLLRFWVKHYPAEDVRRLVRRERLRASFRREWYGLAARFAGPQSRSWSKCREYRAVSDATREFLRAKASGSVPPGG
ncbi:MAG TPA: glycosyltransferase family 2 protein [Verrucomicrobiae bacterium]